MVEHMGIHPQFDVVAMWDPDAAACTLSTQLAPQAVIADSAQAAIETADLVYLACPPKPRKAYALMAALAGKGVFWKSLWVWTSQKAGIWLNGLQNPAC